MILTRNADQINCEMLSSPQKTEDYHTNVCKNTQKSKVFLCSQAIQHCIYLHKVHTSKSLNFHSSLRCLASYRHALHDSLLKQTFKTTYIVLKSGLPSNAPSGITEIELL